MKERKDDQKSLGGPSTKRLAPVDELLGPEAQLPEGRHCPHLAAMNDNVDVLQYLYTKNPDSFKLRDNQGKTPLVLAVENGCLAAFRLIVQEYKESIEWKGTSGGTILEELIKVWSDSEPFSLLQLRQLALFEEIIRRYPDLLTRENSVGFPLIACAAGWGRVKLLEKILQHSPNLYRWQHATSGRTLIHQAAEYDHPRIYVYFKENYPKYTQSTLTQKTTKGLTPLGMAAVNGSLDVFKRLEEDNKAEALLQAEDNKTVVHAIIVCYRSDENGQTSQQKKLQEMLTYISKNYSKSLFTQKGMNGYTPTFCVAIYGASQLLPILVENDSKCHEHTYYKDTLESKAACFGHVHLLENFKKRGWLNLQSLTDFLGNSRLQLAIEAMRCGYFNIFKWYQNNILKDLQSTWPIDILYFLMIWQIQEENLNTIIDLAKSGNKTSFSIVELIDHLIRGVDPRSIGIDASVAVEAKSYWFLAYFLAKKIPIGVIPESLKKELQDLIDSSASRFLPLYFHLCYVPDKSGYAFPKPVVHTILDYAMEYVIDSLILCVMKEEKPTTLGQQTFFFQYACGLLESSEIGQDLTRTIIQEAELLKFEKSSQTQAGLFSKSTESSSFSSASTSTSTQTLIP